MLTAGDMAVVVVVEGATPGLPARPVNRIGVVDPGFGFQPGGGLVCDGTRPAVGTTTGAAGLATVGVWWAGTGVPGECTRPKPARSDHQIELTRTTSSVWGALIMSPPPM